MTQSKQSIESEINSLKTMLFQLYQIFLPFFSSDNHKPWNNLFERIAAKFLIPAKLEVFDREDLKNIQAMINNQLEFVMEEQEAHKDKASFLYFLAEIGFYFHERLIFLTTLKKMINPFGYLEKIKKESDISKEENLLVYYRDLLKSLENASLIILDVFKQSGLPLPIVLDKEMNKVLIYHLLSRLMKEVFENFPSIFKINQLIEEMENAVQIANKVEVEKIKKNLQSIFIFYEHVKIQLQNLIDRNYPFFENCIQLIYNDVKKIKEKWDENNHLNQIKFLSHFQRLFFYHDKEVKKTIEAIHLFFKNRSTNPSFFLNRLNLFGQNNNQWMALQKKLLTLINDDKIFFDHLLEDYKFLNPEIDVYLINQQQLQLIRTELLMISLQINENLNDGRMIAKSANEMLSATQEMINTALEDNQFKTFFRLKGFRLLIGSFSSGPTTLRGLLPGLDPILVAVLNCGSALLGRSFQKGLAVNLTNTKTIGNHLTNLKQLMNNDSLAPRLESNLSVSQLTLFDGPKVSKAQKEKQVSQLKIGC